MQMNTKDVKITKEVKCVVVGDLDSQQVPLLLTYTTGSYPSNIPATFDNRTYDVELEDGTPMLLSLWNTHNLDAYPKVRQLWYPSTEVFICLFSVVSPKSFTNAVETLLIEVMHHCPGIPIVLGGTNADKMDDPATHEALAAKNKSPITCPMGETLAKLVNAVGYVECSAKNEKGIKQLFELAIRAALAPDKAKKPSNEYIPLFDEMRHGNSALDTSKVSKMIKNLANLHPSNPSEQKILEMSYHHYILGLAIQNQANQEISNDIHTYFENNLLNTAAASKKPLNLSGHNIRNIPNRLFQTVKWEALDLSFNLLTIIPTCSSLKSLNIAFNNLKEIPEGIIMELPKLESLNVSCNFLDSLPRSLAALKDLKAFGNPLSSILPPYRVSNEKIFFYLKLLAQGQAQTWDRTQMIVVGEEESGKTNLLRILQNEKFESAYNPTSGINVATLSLNLPKSKNPINVDVWDFGGQPCFHAAHRFCMVPNSLFLVVCNMSKPKGLERLKHWVDQISSVKEEVLGSKPIIIVGTHSELLSKSDRQGWQADVEKQFPSPIANKFQIQGVFTVGLKKQDGISELKAKVVEVALQHPKIGLGKVSINQTFTLMQAKIKEQKSFTPYLWWQDYLTMASNLEIPEEGIQEITTLLHVTGNAIWHNIPKLRDIVILDPQWFADAAAAVSKSSISHANGVASWSAIREALKPKFPEEFHVIVLPALEHLEVVYRITGANSNELTDGQMFFIPSLLAAFTPPETAHPAYQLYHSIKPRNTYIRRFWWSFFPSGFFSCLLGRMIREGIQLAACWSDAAVVLGRTCDEFVLLHLQPKNSTDYQYCLEVRAKVEELREQDTEPLIAELAYLVSRTHRDLYELSPSEIPLVHQVVVISDEIGKTEQVIPFQDCISAEMANKAVVNVGGRLEKISDCVQDKLGFKQISDEALFVEKKLKEGISKGRLLTRVDGKEVTLDVALQDTKVSCDTDLAHDLQHRIVVMSKIQHENLVKVYGTSKPPLRLVTEYVSEYNLQELLDNAKLQLSLKWKLKLATDCAFALEHLHSQSPPICCGNLRATNILIADFDDDTKLASKIGNYGLSPEHSESLTDTAPEAWDGGTYTEKADVFSFGLILWHLFGSSRQNRKIITARFTEDSDWNYLKMNGQLLLPIIQRDIIRKGERPLIHSLCPKFLSKLIQDCWHNSPDCRPTSSSIREQLMTFYTGNYYYDPYYVYKRPKRLDIAGAPVLDASLSGDFQSNNCMYPVLDIRVVHTLKSGKATGFLELPFEVWIGASDATIEIYDKKAQQFVKQISLVTVGNSSRRRMALVAVNRNFLWIPEGSYIYVVSIKKKMAVTAPLRNGNQITAITSITNTSIIWVADTEGFISLWNTQTNLKCLQFKINAQGSAQCMALLFDHVWMAVGKEVIAIHTKTLQKVTAEKMGHTDKITVIIAIPQTNQVWTFGRDNTISVWSMQPGSTTNILKLEKQLTLPLPPSLPITLPSSGVKCACLLTDDIHVCSASFDGTLHMWNIYTFANEAIPTPADLKQSSIMSVLDTENGLWCGIEVASNTTIFLPHIPLKVGKSKYCYSHNRSYHDFYISHNETTDSLSPVKSVYEGLIQQKKRRTIDSVSVFWDTKCLHLNQAFSPFLFNSKVIVLMISAKALEGIKKNAPKQQEKLLRYELALLQHKTSKTPILLVLLATWSGASPRIQRQTSSTRPASGGQLGMARLAIGVRSENIQETSYVPFGDKEFDPDSFPHSPHIRAPDIQAVIDEKSAALPPEETEFLNTIAATIEQIGKMAVFRLDKRGADTYEFNQLILKLMDEVERR